MKDEMAQLKKEEEKLKKRTELQLMRKRLREHREWSRICEEQLLLTRLVRNNLRRVKRQIKNHRCEVNKSSHHGISVDDSSGKNS